MLKGRGRDPRMTVSPRVAGQPQDHVMIRQPSQSPAIGTRPVQTHLVRPASQTRAPLAKPEPEYEVVEFPTEQYVNAKLQPPPPPPPRPPTGHPVDADASCGLCGGGGARVRCAECGRRALCASCDDMYHRHPKRRHHQRQALSTSQMRDERPPLPPKATPPVPPPRRHKMSGDRMSASPRPGAVDQRRATLGHLSIHNQTSTLPLNNHVAQNMQQLPPHLQGKLSQTVTGHLGSMPYLPQTILNAPVPVGPTTQSQTNTLGHVPGWGRPRGSMPAFNIPPNVINQPVPTQTWETPEVLHPQAQNWGRPLRRGASVLELGDNGVSCGGCGHCGPAPVPWRYGSCASLDHGWGGWGAPPPCCVVPHPPAHPHMHGHPSQTPQPYRRVESRTMSRTASRAGSRAASPAMSVRSRTSRRTKHRSPSPPPLPSSDADSESESENERAHTRARTDSHARSESHARTDSNARSNPHTRVDSYARTDPHARAESHPRADSRAGQALHDELGPPPPIASTAWQCEHCTFVNEPGVRVCAVCCRTPSAAPTIIDNTRNMTLLRINERNSPSPAPAETVIIKINGESNQNKQKKERISTGCGPSPPKDEKILKKPLNRLVTPTRESSKDRVVELTKLDTGVGPSPPREVQSSYRTQGTVASPTREFQTVRLSPRREEQVIPRDPPEKHSVSVGPSPPRDTSRASVGTSPSNSSTNTQKKSSGTSPPRQTTTESRTSTRGNVSNTGTSPPPQSISTQTYEVPNSWERAPSASQPRSRARRRFRDEGHRERSHSRHSMSSDTRESERSARTSGGGRWEWREREPRDSSPGGDGGEWSDAERRRESSRLTRRASHLDLRRTRPVRRSSFYGSGAASPEPLSSGRAVSLEALVNANGRREAERGLELARLMESAERLGFSAAEVHAALAQSPAAPLAWLRERWPSLCAGVRAAAARLAPHAPVSEREARAALARHRGAMWPAVTDCVERHRRQAEAAGAGLAQGVGPERRLRGRVWGSPAGADDDAAPPPRLERRPREDSSDEFEEPGQTKFEDDDWKYLPLNTNDDLPYENNDPWNKTPFESTDEKTQDIALKLKSLLIQAGIPAIDENLLLKGLLTDNAVYKSEGNSYTTQQSRPHTMDFIQSENDFIDAYNALTRLSPLPMVNKSYENVQGNDKTLTAKSNRRDVKNNTPSYLDNSNNEITKSPINETDNNLIKKTHQEKEISSVKEKPMPLLNAAVTTLEKMETTVEEIASHTILQTAIITYEPEESKLIANIKVLSVNGPVTSPEKTETNQLNDKMVLPTSNEESNTQEDNLVSTTTNNNIERSNIETNLKIDIENYITRPEEERNKNLNDIVDNTQKLIQQMRDEINSDINSYEDSNISQSEGDTSSNESDFSSEHESSYSDTEEQTDNLTSNDESVSSSENEEDQVTERHTMMHRTSSEDNEQFEEAMDHIEDQIEDFKHTNIEILDTIARSLQEEHTLSIEINEDKIPDNKVIKQQDKNNNIFAKVNSFEEIYEQLNSDAEKHSNNHQNNVVSFKNEVTTSDIHTAVVPQKTNIDLHKQAINIVTFRETSRRLFITELNQPMFNAVIEDMKPIQENENIVESETAHIGQLHSASNFSFNLENDDEDMGEPGELEDMEEGTINKELNVDNIVHSDHSKSRSPERLYLDNAQLSIDNINLELIHRKEDSPPTVTIKISPEKIVLNEDQYNSSNSTTENKSTDNIITHENDNNNRNTALKSNIPKLIKVVSNNKQKGEKPTPKQIVSKVPVRRSSVKQYPAPAPPKRQFGNIQSGFVKQLQSKLFNDKTPKTTVNIPVTVSIEAKASTSTLSKKKTAPPPPSKPQSKQPSPPPPHEQKKNYFRETCRTEDEWTESETEDSELQIAKPSSEEPLRAPSPPPPVTVRRVSGQIIDLATVQLPEGSPERQARMLLAEGAIETWEQAQLAVELVSRGTEPPAALLAALECADLPSALAYLHQECELCASRLPEHEMVSMLRCIHRCCRECARHYFTVQITERSIADCVCPYCKDPELESLPEDSWLEYFAHLDILLKTLLDADVHELFQRKLRDRTLARDPNFRWCMECSSGFFVHPKQKKLRCPECRSVSCASCRKPWSANHEGLTCDQYTKWLEDNDPELSISAVQQHLRENGLECPRCHFKYSLSRGGCMHFTCTQCKYEFCYGCGKPFTMGARCGLSDYCAKLGLHAHHPRNCLFYLRDKEPHELQTLLQMNNVTYETESQEGGSTRCPIQLQRETPTGLIDGTCGGDVPAKHAGLCKNHYLEYLSRLVRRRGVDPLPLLAIDDLETLVKRAALRPPPRPYGTLEGLYRRALLQVCDRAVCCRPHYVEYLAGLARALDPIPIMDVPELVAELRRRALPLPERGPWDTDPIYAGMCAEIVREKIPLD